MEIWELSKYLYLIFNILEVFCFPSTKGFVLFSRFGDEKMCFLAMENLNYVVTSVCHRKCYLK